MLVVLIAFTGCSDKQSLKGKITFSDDGSPLPVGEITFATSTCIARGNINADGSYAVGSTGKRDGIPKGEYQVYIVGAENVKVTFDKGVQKSNRTPLIDAKYASAETSGLTFTADGTTRRFDIQVDRPK